MTKPTTDLVSNVPVSAFSSWIVTLRPPAFIIPWATHAPNLAKPSWCLFVITLKKFLLISALEGLVFLFVESKSWIKLSWQPDEQNPLGPLLADLERQ